MKTRDHLDTILRFSCERIQDEVASLIGKPFKLGEPEFKQMRKEDLFIEAGGKSILAHVRMDGEVEGQGCLLVRIADAIRLGGMLIMLPDAELGSVVTAEEYSEELQDSFGEVANVICGGVTSAFEEQFAQKIRFIRTEQETVVPVKVVADSDQPVPDGEYYVMTVPMEVEGHELGRLLMALPAAPLGLELATKAAVDSGEALAENASSPEVHSPTAETDGTDQRADDFTDAAPAAAESPGFESAAEPVAEQEPVSLRPQAASAADILIYTDDDREGDRIAAAAQQLGYAVRMLHFKDPVASVLTPQVQMVFLVMKEVSEQGFGVAIKLNSAGLRAPLVAAGPAWTRSLVLKAVKYGAGDILVTPPSADDVRKKIETNLIQRAA